MTEMEVPEIIGAEPLASQLGTSSGSSRGEVDAEAERASILPAHRVVEQALAATRQLMTPRWRGGWADRLEVLGPLGLAYLTLAGLTTSSLGLLTAAGTGGVAGSRHPAADPQRRVADPRRSSWRCWPTAPRRTRRFARNPT